MSTWWEDNPHSWCCGQCDCTAVLLQVLLPKTLMMRGTPPAQQMDKFVSEWRRALAVAHPQKAPPSMLAEVYSSPKWNSCQGDAATATPSTWRSSGVGDGQQWAKNQSAERKPVVKLCRRLFISTSTGAAFSYRQLHCRNSLFLCKSGCMTPPTACQCTVRPPNADSREEAWTTRRLRCRYWVTPQSKIIHALAISYMVYLTSFRERSS